MNRVITGALVGIVSITTLGGVFAAESTNTTARIMQIRDPLEQCLAYVKMKWLTNIDCKAKIASMKQENQLPRRVEKKDNRMMQWTGMMMSSRSPRPPMGSGAMMGSGMRLDHECSAPGSCGQWLPPPARWTGSQMMIEQQMKWLGMAMTKLTPEQRDELMKTVRSYLESKWVTLPTQEAMKNMKGDMKDEIKDMKSQIKNKKEEKNDLQKSIDEYTNNVVNNSLKNMQIKARDELRAKQEKLRMKKENDTQEWESQDNSSN